MFLHHVFYQNQKSIIMLKFLSIIVLLVVNVSAKCQVPAYLKELLTQYSTVAGIWFSTS